MKNLLQLTLAMYTEVCMVAGAETHYLDLKQIESRFRHEGSSFLTITLPDFAAAFEQGLEKGFILPSAFPAFKHRSGWSLPQFLMGLTSKVFDAKSGVLLENPDTHAVWAVRQLCLLMKKVELDASPLRTRKALRKFEETDKTLRPFRSMPRSLAIELKRVFASLFGSSLSRLEEDLRDFPASFSPAHGPGAVLEGIRGNKKFSELTWYNRLDKSFPPDLFAVPNLGANGLLERVCYVEIGAEQPVRVVCVTKTLKGPRVIAIEPVCYQFVQQALWRRLGELLADSFKKGLHTIQFKSQEQNGNLALLGSIRNALKRYATIDLSEASDRLLAALVSWLLSYWPTLRAAVFRCRSPKANLGDNVITLRKFATSGSALCFPIETMVFYAMAVTGRMQGVFNARRLRKAAAETVVFGDDIVVDKDHAPNVIDTLEAFGLKVNRNKTFYVGSFRESCGVDAFMGENITPVYLRTPLDVDDVSRRRIMKKAGGNVAKFKTSLRDLCRLRAASWMATANQLHKAGLWECAKRIEAQVGNYISELPVVLEHSSAIGRINHFGDYTSPGRWNKYLQRFEVLGWTVEPVSVEDPLDGYDALLKVLTVSFQEDAKHLMESVRPRALKLKRGWLSPA